MGGPKFIRKQSEQASKQQSSKDSISALASGSSPAQVLTLTSLIDGLYLEVCMKLAFSSLLDLLWVRCFIMAVEILAKIALTFNVHLKPLGRL